MMMDIMAHNSGIQDKLRAEIVEAQKVHGKDIPHDVLVELPYLDAFCRETLRVYVNNTTQLPSAIIDSYG